MLQALQYICILLGVVLTAFCFRKSQRSINSILLSIALFGIILEALISLRLLDGIPILKEISRLKALFFISMAQVVAFVLFTESLARSGSAAILFKVKWKIVPAIAALPVLAIFLVYSPSYIYRTEEIFGFPVLVYTSLGKTFLLLQIILCITAVYNIERVIRIFSGTRKWKVKLLGIGVVTFMAIKIYAASQQYLYTYLDRDVETAYFFGAGVGMCLIYAGLRRGGLKARETYFSQSFLKSSITLLATGVYLFLIGILSKYASYWEEEINFPIRTAFITVALGVLVVLLISDRMKLRLRRSVALHFNRPMYEARRVWMQFTEQTSGAETIKQWCDRLVNWISETFQILSVGIWVKDSNQNVFRLVNTTLGILDNESNEDKESKQISIQNVNLTRYFIENPGALRLNELPEKWKNEWNLKNPAEFPKKGGEPYIMPIIAQRQLLGLVSLKDRVEGEEYSEEELDLMRCIGHHAGSWILNKRLSEKVADSREMEAFHRISTFFAHDLKNAASSLNIMLINFSEHIDKAEFREDLKRGIAKTVDRINGLIEKIALFRDEGNLHLKTSDLSGLVRKVLTVCPIKNGIELVKTLNCSIPVLMDEEQFSKVVINLVTNAQEALPSSGKIWVETCDDENWGVLSVKDDGCGMEKEFIEQELFKPFRTTKSKGVGIGLYHCRTIMEMHRGKIEVQSTPGKGTTFKAFLPAAV